jgi:hypothetical protein
MTTGVAESPFEGRLPHANSPANRTGTEEQRVGVDIAVPRQVQVLLPGGRSNDSNKKASDPTH